MSDDATTAKSPAFMAADAEEHCCDYCSEAEDALVYIDGDCGSGFICARCLKGALGLLRGLGVTS